PGVYICDRCIPVASEAIATGGPAGPPAAVIEPVAAEDMTERCGFCGQRRHQVPRPAAAPRARICAACLRPCPEILTQRLPQPPPVRPAPPRARRASALGDADPHAGVDAAPVGVQIPAARRGEDIARAPLLARLVPVAPAVRFRAPYRPVPHAARADRGERE